MSSKLIKSAVAAALAGAFLAGTTAQAYEAGDWLVRAGAWGVFPKSDNLTNVLGQPGVDIEADDGYSLGFNFTYMVNPNIGIELLLALPFKHDIELTGAGKVANTLQLPPTLFVQYHFMPTGNIRPYAGIGLNYTYFWDEKTTGALSGTSLSLDSSWGLAGELGVDIDVTPNWFVNGVVGYMDIDTKAKLNGVSLGTVEIDPWVVGINIGTRF
ncbi:MAG: OmpW family outer membrane protein [Candidatus Competibacter sp.]|nr:OmpW family outer membrane protein [Candidatus Competibacter sp.]MDG4582950.1 OmpW family outer membrane protein [Candidatus Competibacter sp.]